MPPMAGGMPPAAPAGTPGPAAMPASPDLNPPANLAPGLKWEAPAKWTTKAASAMRRGSFTIPGASGDADLSIVVLPGAAGGVIENIRRWRGQVGLPAVSDLEIQSHTETLRVDDADFTLVELTDPAGKQTILGAITEHDGVTIFVKAMGPAATLAEARADFRAFLQTVKLH